jgi:hypothetical protein
MFIIMPFCIEWKGPGLPSLRTAPRPALSRTFLLSIQLSVNSDIIRHREG